MAAVGAAAGEVCRLTVAKFYCMGARCGLRDLLLLVLLFLFYLMAAAFGAGEVCRFAAARLHCMGVR